jgi:hypothetical protein
MKKKFFKTFGIKNELFLYLLLIITSISQFSSKIKLLKVKKQLIQKIMGKNCSLTLEESRKILAKNYMQKN